MGLRGVVRMGWGVGSGLLGVDGCLAAWFDGDMLCGWTFMSWTVMNCSQDVCNDDGNSDANEDSLHVTSPRIRECHIDNYNAVNYRKVKRVE